ncbi:hypothetical protein AVEN_164390-1 [Araneus ventricosus]|uniref:Uncharacterized protein n=1 Tax=Araneus ventricosus TaxID=182803 RepID=A0A4Y2T7B6_ARAVE|nr:hypothetical protein AVEN_164390-1 [Araneus ventricosus]
MRHMLQTVLVSGIALTLTKTAYDSSPCDIKQRNKRLRNKQLMLSFQDGKEDVKDEPRSGRPPTSTTPDNIERLRRMLADDRRLSLRMIAEELKISLDSVSNIIHEHLQKRKKKVYAFPTLLRSSNV